MIGPAAVAAVPSSWILTASGVAFDLLDPRPETLSPEDVAHALSHLCRFGGHASAFYSVAQHSVLVSDLVPHSHALAGLLHDASEAYLGDVVSPLKRELARYRELESHLGRVIEARFGLAPGALSSAEVVEADRAALAIERAALLPASSRPWPGLPEGVEPWRRPLEPLAPSDARDLFSARLRSLWSPHR